MGKHNIECLRAWRKRRRLKKKLIKKEGALKWNTICNVFTLPSNTSDSGGITTDSESGPDHCPCRPVLDVCTKPLVYGREDDHPGTSPGGQKKDHYHGSMDEDDADDECSTMSEETDKESLYSTESTSSKQLLRDNLHADPLYANMLQHALIKKKIECLQKKALQLQSSQRLQNSPKLKIM